MRRRKRDKSEEAFAKSLKNGAPEKFSAVIYLMDG